MGGNFKEMCFKVITAYLLMKSADFQNKCFTFGKSEEVVIKISTAFAYRITYEIIRHMYKYTHYQWCALKGNSTNVLTLKCVFLGFGENCCEKKLEKGYKAFCGSGESCMLGNLGTRF